MAVVTGRAERAGSVARALPFADCDVHNALSAPEKLLPYLPAQWRAEYSRGRGPGGTTGGGLYPSRPQNGIFRWDARPPGGGVPGSDLAFMTEHFLNAWPVEHAILAPLDGNGWPQYGAFGGAIATAINDWMIAEWLGRDPRLYGAITIPMEDGEAAANEIRRVASHRRFVQVMMLSRTRDPMGHPRYWPIYRAAAEAGLPIGLHVGGVGNPMTGAGWPSYHFEYHASFVHTFQAQVVSLIASGVFRSIPGVRFVMEEGGFAWLPALLWRMDRAWRAMGSDITHLDAPPSTLVRDHFWFTTQPIDEPERPEQFQQLFAHLDALGMADRIMFSTDYPHWDFDSPEKAFPDAVDLSVRQNVFLHNARKLYRFEVAARD